MDNTGQWEPVDFIALQQLPRALSLMGESMWEEVEERFKTVVGHVKNRTATRTQLEEHSRYIMYAWMSERWWCGLGYFLSSEEPYANVGLILEVAPNSPRRDDILGALRQIDKSDGWSGDSLDQDGVYSNVRKVQPLRTFLGEENHVRAVKEYFLKVLDEVDELRERFSDLPWLPSEEEEEDRGA